MVEKTTNYLKIITLYRTDYTTNLHVRAMAKLLGTSHATLLPYLKQLEKNKILRHERVGRNKQYRLNTANILTKHYLTITEETVTIEFLEKTQLMRKLAEHLDAIDTPNPLILFGSYADGTATEESDIDLFTIGTLTKDQLTHLKKFEATYGKKINVKTTTVDNFNAALRTGDILIKEIIRNHIILQNADLYVTILWRYHAER
jgi:predicted nucleotidyltransferase